MTYEDRNVAYALNSYTWKLLEANLDWTKDPYDGKTPIIPLAQQPELMQSAQPFLVYGAAKHPPEHLYQHAKAAVSYTIYAIGSTEVNRIADLLGETFQRQDEAAADVNEWLSVEEAARGESRGIFFTSIKATMVEKADPSEEEGGYVSALVMIEARYVVTNTTLVTSGFTYT